MLMQTFFFVYATDTPPLNSECSSERKTLRDVRGALGFFFALSVVIIIALIVVIICIIRRR